MKLERREIFTTCVWLGGALAASGLWRWYAQKEMTRTNEWLLIGGGVLLLVALAGNLQRILQYSSSRSGRLGLNMLLMTVGALAIAVFVNFLGMKHSKRWDWTPEQLYTISDETKKVLGNLKEDVKIIRFERVSGQDALGERMAEYKKISPHVSYQVVDPQEQLDIAQKYEVRRAGDIVVTNGTRTEHLNEGDEQSLTTGILKVTEAKHKTVCFVAGHGERSLSDNDGLGFSRVQKELERENYTVKPVVLAETKQVPAECDVVVVAGPKKEFLPEETEALQSYLAGGGKALILEDPGTDTKLDGVLAGWNISVGNNLVLGVSRAEMLSGLGASAPIVTRYGSHPVTETLEKEQRITFFPKARTVDVADKKNAGKPVTDLLMTSERSYAKVNWEKELNFDESKDKAGPLTLGVAEEHRDGGKVTRLVVIGNSAFAVNGYLMQASNLDLFDNSVNWLAQDENLISIKPKSATSRRVTLTQTQAGLFQLFSLVLMPGLVLAAGVAIWWKRR